MSRALRDSNSEVAQGRKQVFKPILSHPTLTFSVGLSAAHPSFDHSIDEMPQTTERQRDPSTARESRPVCIPDGQANPSFPIATALFLWGRNERDRQAHL